MVPLTRLSTSGFKMNKKYLNIICIACFTVVIFGFLLTNIIAPDQEFSYSERRKLAQFPQFSTEEFWSGEFFEKCEDYFLDQFTFRDGFRGFKAYVKLSLLGQKDNNGIYIKDGYIIKIEHPLKESSVLIAANKFNEVYAKYLQDLNVYYSVIPDKNYFTGPENGYLSIDYEKMLEILSQNTQNMTFIDIFPELTLDDYYKTDIHWCQENIIPVADALLKAMNANALASGVNYTRHELSPFYGSYYGHAALNTKPDTLVYLSSQIIENAIAYDYETGTWNSIYIPDNFNNVDPYDVFLSGAKALITIDNPSADTDRELIIFRDSYTSSLAPLLLEGYAKIHLVDLRYITTDYVGELIEFQPGADALFLFGTQVLNNAAMLK